ncbi:MAG: hypothetical protein LBO66_13050 [Deltaproteobacteria bacterium]|jgi:hypothetical protein|nr:hypothetical protein [Deltaproteobacteria bacterium]
MFQALYRQTDPEGRASIYALTDFCLAILARVAEALVILLSVGGLSNLFLRFGEGLWGPGEAALLGAIGGNWLLWALVKTPPALLRSSLASAFGLDSRNLSARLKAVAGPLLAIWLLGTVFTFLFFWTLSLLAGRWWYFASLAWIFPPFLLWALWPRARFRLRPRVYRRPAEGEISGEIDRLFAARIFRREPLKRDIWIDAGDAPGLKEPSFLGDRLVVPEKLLYLLTPRALKFEIVACLTARQFSLKANELVLRLSCVGLAAPTTLILFNSLGLFWGYPATVQPALWGLAGLAVWSGSYLGVIVVNMALRLLSPRTRAAAALFGGDAAALAEALSILARKNLRPMEIPPWMAFFLPYNAPGAEIAKIKEILLELLLKGRMEIPKGADADLPLEEMDLGGGFLADADSAPAEASVSADAARDPKTLS